MISELTLQGGLQRPLGQQLQQASGTGDLEALRSSPLNQPADQLVINGRSPDNSFRLRSCRRRGLRRTYNITHSVSLQDPVPPFVVHTLPEGRHVFPGLPVEKNLLLGAYSHAWNADTHSTLAEVYDLFPVLKEMRGRLAGALSGGQQQMLAIGRALMARPRLLLLDEPSMGLSPKLIEDILDVLIRLRGEGLSLLLVEQNAKLTFGVTSHCLVMENGTVAMTGTSDDLRHDSQVRQIYLGL
ncbi:ATP-binding cassette domain-containing protein [Streptomyces sp. PA03-1a]|nr:ATP-binding cassette domain-containing protein [Streptomyces sp. PA03-1a]